MPEKKIIFVNVHVIACLFTLHAIEITYFKQHPYIAFIRFIIILCVLQKFLKWIDESCSCSRCLYWRALVGTILLSERELKTTGMFNPLFETKLMSGQSKSGLYSVFANVSSKRFPCHDYAVSTIVLIAQLRINGKTLFLM